SLDLARLGRELAAGGFAGGAFREAGGRIPARTGGGLGRRAVERGWGERGGRTRGRTAEGFVTGAIDCVLEHDGRYFVLDYKSNRLGASLDSYATPALVAAMAREHYWLQ